MRIYAILFLLFLCFSPTAVLGQEAEQECQCPDGQVCEDGACADGHNHAGYPPIGVMGGHRHQEGDWMVSYRFRHMKMEGSLNGSQSVTNQQVLNRYMVTPTKMTMTGHMIGLMYAPNDNVTVALMLPYMNKSMDHLTRRGGRFTTSASGLGDIKATAIVKMWQTDKHELNFNAGVSLPTGTIDATDATPMGANTVLPYPMQLGSGSLDLMPGMTYSGHTGDWSWGAQALGTIRTGKNKRGYQLGSVGDFSLWGARQWNENIGTSLRLNGTTWGNISGRDSRLNARVIPTADPGLRAGSRLDALLGLSGDFGNGHRLSIEGGLPIAQSLDGPQLETDFVLTAGWQFAW
jgi:hypothetical protein